MTPVRLRLAELRAARGWSMEVLAEKSGVSRATIFRLEHGQTTRVDFDVLERLADALNVDPAVLIHRTRGKK